MLPFRCVLFTEQMTNKSESYMDAPWPLTFDAEATATHRLAFASFFG